MSNLNRRSRFNTFSYCGTSEAYDKGYDGIDFGESAPVEAREHKGWAGYRLKRVKTETPADVGPMHNVKGQHRAPRTAYRTEFDRIFGGKHG